MPQLRLGPLTLNLGGRGAQKDAVPATQTPGDFITHLPNNGWWPVIKESFASAWQRDLVVPVETAASHPTFFSCLTLIAGDVAKCRPILVKSVAGIKTEQDSASYAVLKKPNHYQNRIQFYSYWVMSKLTRGNAYVLKERDKRNVVVAQYLLDPSRVRPLVAPNGDVYYALGADALAGITDNSVVVPAREIIHDTMYALYHPLCGLSPVYACGHAAVQGLTIVNNATRLFRRGSQVGGVLIAPGAISALTAGRLEKYWNDNYAGEENIGKVAVLGDGLKFERPTVMSAVDSQLIDQLKWDDEKICAVMHVPGYMVGVGTMPTYNNVEALGQQYYGQCLQLHFESMELCQTEGLECRDGYEVEFDIATLDRMDSVQRIDVATKGVVGGIFKPNEARSRFNLPPVPGGDKIYLQKQNWPLEMLGTDVPTEPAPPKPPPDGGTDPQAPTPEKAVDFAELRNIVMKEWAA